MFVSSYPLHFRFRFCDRLSVVSLIKDHLNGAEMEKMRYMQDMIADEALWEMKVRAGEDSLSKVRFFG
jgi:hypothetical protein